MRISNLYLSLIMTIKPVQLFKFIFIAIILLPLNAEGQYPRSFADTVEKILPAVVNIRTLTEQQPNATSQFTVPESFPFSDLFKDFQQQTPDGAPRQAQAQGSGFVIDAKKGLIVTNNHVIDNASKIIVTFQDGTERNATLVGSDVQTDLAVIKIKPFQGLRSLIWANSNRARVGDWVLAIGNPLGLNGTVTSGIISARGRDIDSGPYDDYIQTDASINQGNSGGPLFNTKGEVLGINTAIFSSGQGGSIGIGFAIPSNLARNVVEQLNLYGETKRGWLGVVIQDVTDEIAQSLKLPNSKGAMVSSVQENSPASRAKFKQTDVIILFDGKKVPDHRALPRIVADTPPNKKVSVVVFRNGKKVTLTVMLGKLQNQTARANLAPEKQKKDSQDTIKGSRLNVLGVRVQKLNATLREKYNISANVPNGLLIVELLEVNPDFSKQRLIPSMTITEINNQKVSSVRNAKALLINAKKQGEFVLLQTYSRDGNKHFVGVKLK